MALAAGLAGQAQNNHHRQLHACRNNLPTGFNSLFTADAFFHGLQGSVITSLHAVIQQLQTCFAQLDQLFMRFTQDILRSGISRYSLELRKSSI